MDMIQPHAEPMSPPPRLLIRALIVLFIVGTTGGALSPWLLVEAPLLLVAFSPLPRHVLMVAPQVDFLPLLAIVVLRRQLACVVAYFVGETYGERAIAFVQGRRPWLGRWLRKLMEWFGQAGILLLLLAPNLTAIFAGARRMRMAIFVPASLLGQIWVATATYYLGDSLRDYIDPVIAFVREHTGVLTVSMVAIVGVRHWVRSRRRGRRTRDKLHPE